MLALAPPPTQYSSVAYSQPSSSSARPPRSASSRTPSYSTPPHLSSSSSSTVTESSVSWASTQERPPSPRRAPPRFAQIAQHDPSSSRQNGGGSHTVNDHAVQAVAEPSRLDLRHRPERPEVDIHAYDPHDLLRLLASLLNQIATTNDGLAGRDLGPSYQLHGGQATPPADAHHPPIWRTLTSASRTALSSNMSLTFHARNVPTITLEAYLHRILKYCPASNEVFLSLLVYFDRMSKLAKEACGRAFVIDSYNIHRLVIAGITVASKFFSDVFYTNSRYAKVGGLPQAELNQLELQFLLLNDFRLMISAEEMQHYAEQLIQFSSPAHESSASPSPSPLPSPATSHQSPAGPSKFMAAVDAYRAVPPAHDTGHQTPHVGPRGAFRRSSGSYSSTHSTAASDTASEAGTDFDGSTDDEPTIRPAHSSASSETMSLRSASDADSLYTNDGDQSGSSPGSDGDDDDALAAGAHTPGESAVRDYRMMSP